MLFEGDARQYLKQYQNGKSQVLVLCTQLEGGSDMGQHFQMYRSSVSFHLEGYVLMLLTCDPQGFISGAGFFQSRPTDNYQRGLTDLSACSSWRLGFLTNSWGPRPLEPREVRTHSLESPLASDSLLPMPGLL